MKKYMMYVLIVFICIVGSLNVDALTIDRTTRPTTTSPTQVTTKPACSIENKAKINNLAYQVQASYTFEKDQNGKVVFKITVYNIVDGIYVSITTSDKNYFDDNTKYVFPSNTRGGSYTFEDTNTTDIITYKITVHSSLSGCIDEYRTLQVIKPKLNKYHDDDMCSYAGLEDFYYCREWISEDFNLREDQIAQKIKDKLNRVTTTVPNRCIECEKEALLQKAIERFKKIKSWIIRILIVLIIADITAIFVLLKRIKRFEL